MSKTYEPSPARGATVDKSGDSWTLAMVRELRHPPEKVWTALTDPEHLRQWAPFDSDGNLGVTGKTVKLTTVGMQAPQVAETTITRAEPPHLLEYNWGGNETRWELEATETGTRLKLWAKIDRRYIAMGAAGWHVCIDIMEDLLDGHPVGRLTGMDALGNSGWQGLHAEYAKQFGVEMPSW